ncbi:MAG TPA: hypothetical protein VJ763_02585 [Sphingomicrobium sp.]|jgi:hypothetical protein|nr:hypothetical protein [Sphingomicrobium sp.]
MTRTRPFTLVAAIIFLLMAIGHLYRLAVGFDITVGGTAVPQSVSWVALVVTALLGVMLLRESRS